MYGTFEKWNKILKEDEFQRHDYFEEILKDWLVERTGLIEALKYEHFTGNESEYNINCKVCKLIKRMDK